MLELKVIDEGSEVSLQFEHSLLSLSKWEQKHKKAFTGVAQKRPAELIDYFEYMLLTPDVDPRIVVRLTPDQMDELVRYISDTPSATTFPQERSKSSVGEITNERIYAQMVMLKIPAEYQTWHVNRLMVLIRVIAQAHEPPKKRSQSEIMAEYMQENERRLKEYNTTG